MYEVWTMTCIFLENNKLLTPQATKTQVKNAFKELFEMNTENLFKSTNQ